MIHVLGLLARAGHGKSTVCNYLAETYGVEIVSLARPLKMIAKAVMGFSDEQLWGTQAQKEAIDPRYGMSARIFLQKLGTDGIRTYLGEQTFCEGLALAIRKDHEKRRAACANPDDFRPVVYAVEDARFPNEVDFLNNLDQRDRRNGSEPAMTGYTIKLVCEDAPPSGNDSHASEAGVDKVQPYQLAATVVSRRKPREEDENGNPIGGGFGVAHLISEFEKALELPRLAGLRVALRSGKAGRKAA